MAIDWKQFRPEIHKKTFFKGATSLKIGMERSLDLLDETARELVKETLIKTGQTIPKQTLAAKQKLKRRNSFD